MTNNYSYLIIFFNPIYYCLIIFIFGFVLIITGDECLKPNHKYKNKNENKKKRNKKRVFFDGINDL